MSTTGRCKNNIGEAENVVLIDLENDCFDNVNINIPKSRAKKPQSSNKLNSDKCFPLKTYIYIDDDDDSPPNHHSGTNTHFSQKNRSPVKLSKSKRMYPGRGPTDSSNDNYHHSEKVIYEIEGKSPDDGNVESSNKVILKDYNIDGVLVEGSIANEREKLKETDECKLAQEEELSARQKALKVQAEEAQEMRRFLKRKKDETLRLLDIERRQKQGVEEIQESQKMDEEYMNLKEIYRAKVQKGLKKLELKCHNMASLLHELGILTHKGPYASSQVHAAYKRALLRFHPDRASGSDLRQQVEAEEKFKLISRMKDKDRNTPCLK